MSNLYENEIRVLEENTAIEEKLMIFSLYFECTKSLEGLIRNNFGDDCWKNYQKSLSAAFNLAVDFSNSQGEVSASSVINKFLLLIKNNVLYQNFEIKEIIDELYDEIPFLVESTKPFVKIIDSKNISLDKKSEVLMDFRVFINEVYVKLYQFNLYGEFKHDIYEEAEKILDGILNNESNHSKRCLQNALKYGIKNLLLKLNIIAKLDSIVKTGKYSVFAESLTNDELTCWLYETVYSIAGYEQNEDIEEIFKDISKLMNIPISKILELNDNIFKKAFPISDSIVKLLTEEEINKLLRRKKT